MHNTYQKVFFGRATKWFFQECYHNLVLSNCAILWIHLQNLKKLKPIKMDKLPARNIQWSFWTILIVCFMFNSELCNEFNWIKWIIKIFWPFNHFLYNNPSYHRILCSKTVKMTYKVNFLFNIFVLQSILCLTFRSEIFYVSRILSIFNLTLPNLSYAASSFSFFFVRSSEIYSMTSTNFKQSNFLIFTVQATMVFQPCSMGTLCIMLYRKRYALWRTMTICLRAATRSKLVFGDTVKGCLNLYLILQVLVIIQCLIDYYTFYKISWISAAVALISNWSINMPYYVILLGIFFQKFIAKLLDDCISSKVSIDEISNRINLINELLAVFNDAFGQQLSFVLSTIIYFLVTNVST